MPVSKEQASARMAVCNDCNSYNRTLHTCRQCGCFMPAKSWLKGAKCPSDLWPDLVSIELWTKNSLNKS
jgi:hypothetical protein